MRPTGDCPAGKYPRQGGFGDLTRWSIPRDAGDPCAAVTAASLPPLQQQCSALPQPSQAMGALCCLFKPQAKGKEDDGFSLAMLGRKEVLSPCWGGPSPGAAAASLSGWALLSGCDATGSVPGSDHGIGPHWGSHQCPGLGDAHCQAHGMLQGAAVPWEDTGAGHCCHGVPTPPL